MAELLIMERIFRLIKNFAVSRGNTKSQYCLDLFEKEFKKNMLEWAKREIELACKRARGNRSKYEFDYYCACYESALRAYKSLLVDEHSGMSIGYTKHILDRLIDGKVLTPIEDTPDIWNDCARYEYEIGYSMQQCKRMSSLFKYIYDDGTVKYKDINRFVCTDKDHPSHTWHSGLIDRILDEKFPITMPYMPYERPFMVYCSEALTDPKNGDFDTDAIWYVKKPNGDREDINRFFKEGEEDWIEIDYTEYQKRKEMEITSDATD